MATELTDTDPGRLTAVTHQNQIDIVNGGQVSGIVIKDGHVGFTLEIDPRKRKADEFVN